eukprot:gnl/TRDRNA2_/TRDRNA2_121451_c1_seq1.p1 gnl/TRDRNA2_/TRDRNA2_121451_c1~~gnl/TRDRNA2_/TRDRNA2_121451_c1_seq1.p1  ORF type:complete len:117 (+),score=8.65 gnl/TRDRNA2_/TRDRNA2_121451_c1_seq1:43-351(+)
MLIDEKLFYAANFDLGTFESHMYFKSEDGSRVVVGSSLKMCRKQCLFLCLPIDVQWEREAGVREDFYVIFVGLAALYNQGNITIDIDAGRLKLGQNSSEIWW